MLKYSAGELRIGTSEHLAHTLDRHTVVLGLVGPIHMYTFLWTAHRSWC